MMNGTADVRQTTVALGNIFLLEHVPVPDFPTNIVPVVDSNMVCAGSTQRVYALAETGDDTEKHVEL